ncbi:MAG: ABC transporter ATP-binding protein [Lachnospiraceae bacterium]|nr:ABC transporter ATP-binding protein [Lachnospiraceae bacterium]
MSILNVEHLTHGFGDRAIFNDVSFRLLKGEHIGLVGANGEGKSTFMNIVTGKLMPDEGKVEWAKNVHAGYLDQHAVLEKGMTIQDVLKSAFDPLLKKEERMNEICDHLGEADENEMEALMEELGTIQDELTLHDFYTIDAKVEEVARALGLLDLGLDRDVTDLSGGQRTKVLLAKLLLEKPDILLLDEPTNYLDEEHIAWLKRYLLDYENAFILISHDIPFLNEVINIIYHMENQELNRYVGDYDHFQEVYAVKKSQLEAAYRRQQQEISELKDFVARNKARVSTRNMAMSRQKKLDKMDVIELAAEKPKPEFHFRYGRTPGRMLFETHDLVTGYEEPLSKPLNLSMERGQKIAITGTNGIGKTTLLKSILGLIPALAGTCELGENLQIGYFEQEVKGDNRTTCIEELWQDFPSYTQYEIRSALAKCGLTTKHIESQVRVLSGGEQAKVRLCKLINRDTNVLLLDEPTNHLDVDAKEALKSALKEYKGSILLICHEPEFYQDIVNEVWDMSRWTTKIF